MVENLVIVESPAKAKTIEKLLGKGFSVMSSFGHIRDLSKTKLGIDLENGFAPQYEVPDDKKKTVTELKKNAAKAETIWLASDEDREGEAIAWHLFEVLELSKEKTRRIVFHEITKEAIQNAIQNPRSIDQNLVNAQQARRILDRLVGYELSPLLWKKIKPSLSAGRVQSVAVRLIVEREREIIAFNSTSSFKVTGIFVLTDDKGQKSEIKADLNKSFPTKEEARAFLEQCKNASFTITDVQKKPAIKSPSAPFTTSTLQQEASRKLSFSVSQTMTLAQKLYEAGHITYMRTDSVHLSTLALGSAKAEIISEYGEEYLKTRQWQTKTKGAQEAHEAIRPTYLAHKTITASSNEKRLYDLIWKRTIASQMSEAKLEKTTATIAVSGMKDFFVASGEVLVFPGFLKVYTESTDEDQDDSKDIQLPALKKGDSLENKEITATERFTHYPPRYTEASLVRKLEELGIGRPSTYAPTISTIQNREYVVKEDRPGTERIASILNLSKNTITEKTKVEMNGQEKSKLFPTDTGIVVNDYLTTHFSDVLNFNFTASVEKEFDEIALGKVEWAKMIKEFYASFHGKIETASKQQEKAPGERLLGNDPETGKPVYVKFGRYGPLVQLGISKEEEKPKFASVPRNIHMETITLEMALTLFCLPRTIGSLDDLPVVANIGRFGPYVMHNGKFFSLKKGVDDPYTVSLERAVEIMEEKANSNTGGVLKEFTEETELKILNGRFGPYIKFKGGNYRIPKKSEWQSLSLADCMKIIQENVPRKKGRKK